MLFLFGVAFSGLAISFTGLLMFARPAMYVRVVNWYLSKIGFERRASVALYSRWPYRLSGFMLFLESVLVWYVFWFLLKKCLQ